MAFLWTTIRVNDLEVSKRFYQDIVELPVMREIESSGKSIAFLGRGETQVELIYDSSSATQVGTDQITLGFQVDGVADKKKAIEALGDYQISDIIRPNPNIQFFYVKDPNGINVQFEEIIH